MPLVPRYRTAANLPVRVYGQHKAFFNLNAVNKINIFPYPLRWKVSVAYFLIKE